MKPKRLLLLSLMLALVLAPLKLMAAQATDFQDVQSEDWFSPHVQRAMDLGLMSGYNESTFAPHESLSRGMAATILYRMSGAPAWSFRPVFSDVHEQDYYGVATSFCQEKQIITGLQDGTFRPGEPVSRQDLAVMLWRWARQYRSESLTNQGNPQAYPDWEQVVDYARNALIWAAGSGIINGSQGWLLPADSTTRAQAAKIFSTGYDVHSVLLPDQNPSYTEPQPDPQPEPDLPPAGSPDEEVSDMIGPPQPPKDPVKPGDADDPMLLANVRMFGIDISEHNGDMDLSPYVGQFVIIRAGWYVNEDTMFRKNVAKCEALGIPYGLYWYSYALDEAQSLDEARACIKAVSNTSPALGVWLDMEDADAWKRNHGWKLERETIGPISKVFCDALAQAGYYTGIYSSLSWQPFLEGYCDGYARWMAHWGTNNGDIHFDYSNRAVLHQYTSNPLDKNVLYLPLEFFRFYG